MTMNSSGVTSKTRDSSDNQSCSRCQTQRRLQTRCRRGSGLLTSSSILSSLLLISLTTSSLTHAALTDGETLPFAPSIVDLPYLKLFDDGSRFQILCQLRLDNIPTVTYEWYFTGVKDGEPQLLRNSNKGLYDLTLGNAKLVLKTEEGSKEYPPRLEGFYWCTATNKHGSSTSNRMEARKPAMIQLDSDKTEKSVKTLESSRLQFGFQRDEDNFPVEISFEIEQLGSTPTILRPETSSTYKEGRFVIGSNYDLYILSPTANDDCLITQVYRDYETTSPHPTKKIKFSVESSQVIGLLPPVEPPPVERKFFADFAKTYVFVRGVKSHFTCIPTMPEKVTFRFQNKILDPTSDVIDDGYFRSDYSLFFPNPTEDQSGEYTCIIGRGADEKSITYTVKVIGPPKIDCNFHELVIRSPESDVSIECEIHSDFMKIGSTHVFVNGTDFGSNGQQRAGDNFVVSVSTQGVGYKVRIDGTKLSKFDSTVFRMEAAAGEMAKQEILDRVAPGNTYDVYFNDFALLPFQSRKEVVLTVISRAPTIFDKDANSSVLIGSKNERIVYSIFGSPIPEVNWLEDGNLIVKNDPKWSNFEIKQISALEFSLIIKEVSETHRYQVSAQNEISPIAVMDVHTITAHQPLTMKSSPKTRYYGVLNEPVVVQCSAKQAFDAKTLPLDFLWSDRERGIQLTTMTASNVVLVRSFADENGFTTSNLTLVTEGQYTKLKCTVRLGTLDEGECDIVVEAGARPATPTQFRLEGEWFKWYAQRDESFERDIVEWSAKYSDRTEPWSEYATTTDMKDVRQRESDAAAVPISMEKSPRYDLRPGTKYVFRVRTKNLYAFSGWSTTTDLLIPDTSPDKMIEGLHVLPDTTTKDSRKIVVAWNKFQRSDYMQYQKGGCCIKLRVMAEYPKGNSRTLNEDCIDPEKDSTVIGWNDMHPYTEHVVEAWFANSQGEVPENKIAHTKGFNGASQPSSAPRLTDDQPEIQPTDITVRFYALDQDDINGEFKYYKLDVRDQATGQLYQGVVQSLGYSHDEVKEITVTGLNPYTLYDVELSVHNTGGFSTSTDPWDHKTKADKPGKIDRNLVVTQVFPGGVWAFWTAPVMNGEFETYKLGISPNGFGRNTETYETVVEKQDFTDYFYPQNGSPKPLAEYRYSIVTKNHYKESDPLEVMFQFELGEKQPILRADQVPDVECDDFLSNSIRVKWSYLDFGQYASSHSVEFRTESGNSEDRRVSCSRIPVWSDDQFCDIETLVGTSIYYVRLIAHNTRGEAYSREISCTAGAASMQKSGGGGMAMSPLYAAILGLILLIVLVALIILYYRKNRSHPYRIREKESKYRPKDAESFPRKDDTNKFDEYHPDHFGKYPTFDRHPLMGTMPPTPYGDTQSMNNFDDDDEDLDGFNEDGSFLDAYGLNSMDNPIVHLNTGV